MKYIQLTDYQIMYGDIDQALAEYLEGRSYTSIFIIVDENTKEHCLPLVKSVKGYHLIEIKSGELHKNLSTCQEIWSAMAKAGADRHSLVIDLGGGVIGDMGGFAASCYMRGVDFVQVPTTLLSQVDASVGGKLAVDFQGLKNFIGLFKNPKSVIVDPQCIQTLIPAELRSGYAEMIKHALIQDANIWDRITGIANWRELDWQEEIFASVLIKKKVVEEDPTEKGLRKILNFGHTIGHAVESLSFETDQPFLHGEAIAIGMICEAYISTQRCGLSQAALGDIQNYILNVYPDLDLEILNRKEEILEKLKSDKKNKGGRYLFALLRGIGDAVYDIDVSAEEIFASLDYLLAQS